MNLLSSYLNAGAPTGASTAAASYPTNLFRTADIVSYWNYILQQNNTANNAVAALTANLAALETGVSGGGFAYYVALQLSQTNSLDQQNNLIHQHSALSYIGTSGPLLLAAYTAQFLTPLTQMKTNFQATYQTQLHAAGLV